MKTVLLLTVLSMQSDAVTPFGEIRVNDTYYFRPVLSLATHHSDDSWSYEFQCPKNTKYVIGADKPGSSFEPYCK